MIRYALIPTDVNPSGIEWNSRTQDLYNLSLMKIRWAYHNGRPAPRQQDYKPTTTPLKSFTNELIPSVTGMNSVGEIITDGLTDETRSSV
jgi:hypothetical protein